MSAHKRTPLTPEQERALRLAVEDRDFDEIAAALGKTRRQVQNTLFQGIRARLGVATNFGAVALYANRLGLQGEALGGSYTEEPFVYGELRYRAYPISWNHESPDNVVCRFEDESYAPPPVLAGSLAAWRDEAIARAKTNVRHFYNSTITVLHRIESSDENFEHLTLTLRKTDYYTYRAMREGLSVEGASKYLEPPYHLVNPQLPLAIGVSLWVIAGRPPELMVLERARNHGSGAGQYAASVQGWGEVDEDVMQQPGGKIFDYVKAMHREFGEERDRFISLKGLRQRLHLLTLAYDYHQRSYVLVGAVFLPEVPADTFRQIRSKAKEGRYVGPPQDDPLLFPVPGPRGKLGDEEKEKLQAIRNHLVTHPWLPTEAMSLVSLLERWLPKREVQQVFGMAWDNAGA